MTDPRYSLYHGDCLEWMPQLPDRSVDCVIADPPYPEIARPYGRMTEAQWAELMHAVVRETRRVLKPHGSAVFILQPNSEKIGKMRPWLWDFMAWCCREWNVVQDVYWWNITAQPNAHTWRTRGLTRGSLKTCVWLGSSDCYRNQDAVLIAPGEWSKIQKQRERILEYMPSGYSIRRGRVAEVTAERNGATPFNVLPIAVRSNEAGAHGHGAGTPLQLADWWTRYISKPGDTILDMFCGSGTMGIAALQQGRKFIGIELYPLLDRPVDPKTNPNYFFIGHERMAKAAAAPQQLSMEAA